MTRNEEIEMEIRNQAAKLYPKCVALFELPLMVYNQIIADNDLRKKPYKLGFSRVQKVINTMTF